MNNTFLNKSQLPIATELFARTQIEKKMNYGVNGLSITLHPHEVAMLAVMSVMGVMLNTLVIVSIMSKRATRKRVTNIFVVSLTCTQFLVSAFVLPTFCVPNLTAVHEHVTAFSVMSYVCNLCAITYERYVAVKNSLRYRDLIPFSTAMKIVVACWGIAAMMQVRKYLTPFEINSPLILTHSVAVSLNYCKFAIISLISGICSSPFKF